MAHNFKICLHPTPENLYIDLTGDFDGSSAFELLNALKQNLNSHRSILIDTNNLKKVYPFGRDLFNNKFVKLRHRRMRIRFIGPNALQFASI